MEVLSEFDVSLTVDLSASVSNSSLLSANTSAVGVALLKAATEFLRK